MFKVTVVHFSHTDIFNDISTIAIFWIVILKFVAKQTIKTSCGISKVRTGTENECNGK